MKISDKEKGINHNLYGWTEEDQNEYYDYLATQEQEPEEETDYVLEMIQKNEQAQIEWEKQAEKILPFFSTNNDRQPIDIRPQKAVMKIKKQGKQKSGEWRLLPSKSTHRLSLPLKQLYRRTN